MRASRNNERGVITLVALCLSAVIGIALASYVALCYQSLAHSTRTLHVAHARELAETGLEQALWSLNTLADPVTSVSTTAWNNASWNAVGANTSCTLTASNLSQGATGQVVVTITNFASSTPTITAVATVTAGGVPFTKTLTATTQYAPLFGNAIATCGSSSLSSLTYRRVRFQAGGTVDSYNSVTGAYGGANVGYAAVVASSETDSTRTGVTLGTAQVNGYLTTSGAVFNTTTGKLKGPLTGGGVNVDTTRMGKSAFTPQFDIVEPTGTVPLPASPIGTPGATTPSDYYVSGDLDLTGSSLTINGPVRIVVNQQFKTAGTTNGIVVSSTGSLELFVRGSVSMAGAVGISSSAPTAANPWPSKVALYAGYYSAGSQFTYAVDNTNKFYGVMYWASTTYPMNFTTSGEIYGAILADYRVNFATGYTPLVHYDTALRTARFSRIRTPYLVNQITEQ